VADVTAVAASAVAVAIAARPEAFLSLPSPLLLPQRLLLSMIVAGWSPLLSLRSRLAAIAVIVAVAAVAVTAVSAAVAVAARPES
jgi:hypothetical protein